MADDTSSQAERVTGRDADRILMAGPLITICITIAVMVLFNVFPDRVGVYVSAGDPARFIPVLSPTFLDRHLPWLNAWWALTLALNLSHLGLRRWIPATRWADFALNIFGLAILVRLITGGPIIGSDPAWARAGIPLVDLPVSVVTASSFLVTVVLALAILGTGVDTVKKLARLARDPSRPVQARSA